METEQKKLQGESAPSTAQTEQNEDQPDDFRVVDEESSENEEKEASDAGDGTSNKVHSSEEIAEGDTVTEGAGKNRDKDDEEASGSNINGAARRKYKEEAWGEPLQSNNSQIGFKRAPDVESDSSPSPKKAKRNGRTNIKVCVVSDTFPEENLTSGQSKDVQESIMDQILEMGTASSIKPKFLSSEIQEHGLTIICADQTTVDWLKIVAPTLRPWEGALLKALENDEMPHPFIYVGFLPESKDYSDEKVLKLLEAQNESFNVHTWKIVNREVVDSELQLTIIVDRKYTTELRAAGCKVNYKFGNVQLWPKFKKAPRIKSNTGDSNSPKFGSKPPSKSFRGGPPPGASNWRGEVRGRGDRRVGKSRSRVGPLSRGAQERGGFSRSSSRSRGRRDRRASFRGSSFSDRGGMSWQADPW